MSLMTQIGPLVGKIQNWRNLFSYRDISFTTSQKVVIWSVGVMGVSVVVVGVLARHLARRRTPTIPNPRLRKLFNKRFRNSGMRSPNGDVVSVSGSSGRASRSPRRFGSSIASERLSLASGSLGAGVSGVGGIVPSDAPALTPQQLGVMGMEALETSINYWEDALSAFSSGSAVGSLALTTPEEAEFCREIQQLLDAAYLLQEQSELLFLDQRSVLFRCESGSGASGSAPRPAPPSKSHHSHHQQDCNHSSAESFASAQDEVADLREFEEFSELFPDIEKLTLYQSALKKFENGIPYRTLRTETVQCGSDVEYLCKLHCIRLAFQLMFKDPNTWSWFADTGRQMLTDLLLFAEKDPKEFLVAYEEMLSWISEIDNWEDLELELDTKGVKVLTFYDVVLDYILLDAFEDLDAPPSSVTAVVQNRWLSNGFKETALTTAVWSVLKAKRRMLKYPDGFMAHFYMISEQISPLMAWGFLGPDDSLRDTCNYFKEQIMLFLVDIFNFQRTRYNSVEDLSVDITLHIRTRINNISQKLCPGT